MLGIRVRALVAVAILRADPAVPAMRHQVHPQPPGPPAAVILRFLLRPAMPQPASAARQLPAAEGGVRDDVKVVVALPPGPLSTPAAARAGLHLLRVPARPC